MARPSRSDERSSSPPQSEQKHDAVPSNDYLKVPAKKNSSEDKTYTSVDDSLSTVSASTLENLDSAKNSCSLPSTASVVTPIESDNVQPCSEESTQIYILSRLRRMGWWWEWAAVVVSVLCTLLTVAVLVRMDGKPMRAWQLAIQPTSLIAFLTNIGTLVLDMLRVS